MPVTNYIWDELSDTVLMETDGSGNPTAVYTNEPGQFGALISERQGNQSQYYHYDGLGSTRQLTNSTGELTDSYIFDAFGNTVQSTGTSVVPYHFVGRYGYYLDQELADYYARARQYISTLARWLSEDPTEFDDGLNVYAYSHNSPVNRLDPDGTKSILEALIEAILPPWPCGTAQILASAEDIKFTKSTKCPPDDKITAGIEKEVKGRSRTFNSPCPTGQKCCAEFVFPINFSIPWRLNETFYWTISGQKAPTKLKIWYIGPCIIKGSMKIKVTGRIRIGHCG